MEKRFFFAITLSILVLLFYSSLVPKTQPVVNKYVATNVTSAVSQVAEPVIKENSEQDFHNLLLESNLYNLKSDGLEIKFSKKGAFIYEVFDKTTSSTIAIKDIGLVKEWSQYSFNASPLSNGVIFDYKTEDGQEIKKKFILKSNNVIELTIAISNITSSKITSYNIFAGYNNPAEDKNAISQRYHEASILLNDVIVRKPTHGLKNQVDYSGKISWVGLRDRYFCVVLIPQLTVNKGFIDILDKGSYLALNIPERNLVNKNSLVEDQYNIYIGPQEEQSLKSFSPGAERIISYGTFDPIAKVLLFLLHALHNLTKNWGVSIICVTILVYIVLFPLSFKSMLSMKKMQALQPKIEEVRTKYKDNPQKLNVEIMELYKREKVNPFGGCLPLLLQIPVFFALYQLLMRLISLKGAHFLWIKDLSEPDRLLYFKNALPIMGNELNILPLLMAFVMFGQQKFTSATASAASSSAAEQQKMMAIMMPVIFGVLFYKMSSGLVLYWLVNSLLMLGFQWKISKIKTT